MAIGARALSSIGEFLIWRSMPNLPNHQIKNLTKVSRYTVATGLVVYITSLRWQGLIKNKNKLSI